MNRDRREAMLYHHPSTTGRSVPGPEGPGPILPAGTGLPTHRTHIAHHAGIITAEWWEAVCFGAGCTWSGVYDSDFDARTSAQRHEIEGNTP